MTWSLGKRFSLPPFQPQYIISPPPPSAYQHHPYYHTYPHTVNTAPVQHQVTTTQLIIFKKHRNRLTGVRRTKDLKIHFITQLTVLTSLYLINSSTNTYGTHYTTNSSQLNFYHLKGNINVNINLFLFFNRFFSNSLHNKHQLASNTSAIENYHKPTKL